MNHQTRKKAEDIKSLLAEGLTKTEIQRKKFSRSSKKLLEFLEKTEELFTDKELEVLMGTTTKDYKGTTEMPASMEKTKKEKDKFPIKDLGNDKENKAKGLKRLYSKVSTTKSSSPVIIKTTENYKDTTENIKGRETQPQQANTSTSFDSAQEPTLRNQISKNINNSLPEELAILSEKENMEVLRDLILNGKEILQSIKKGSQNDHMDVLIVPNEILKLVDTRVRSVRISEEIENEFNKIVKAHPNYSKMNLINMALQEFVERYS